MICLKLLAESRKSSQELLRGRVKRFLGRIFGGKDVNGSPCAITADEGAGASRSAGLAEAKGTARFIHSEAANGPELTGADPHREV